MNCPSCGNMNMIETMEMDTNRTYYKMYHCPHCMELKFEDVTKSHMDNITVIDIERNPNRCPFTKICPKLRKINKQKTRDIIFGYCDYQPQFQAECIHYKRFIFNPSYRGRN